MKAKQTIEQRRSFFIFRLSAVLTEIMAAKSLEGTLQKNLEYFSCVWVDREVNTSADNLKLQKKIRACIDHLRTFDNEEDCIEQIRAGRTQKILLIVSGRAGSLIIPLIHHLTQLAAFYVFCANQQWNEEWSCKYSKVNPFHSARSSSPVFFSL